jgi:Fe2+ or Zn2+ uptake regulation protein
MNNPFPFRASKSRPTKQQEQQRIINEQIINYMTTLQEDKNAETLWLGMNDQGYNMSISSFNTRLKKLVEAGMVEKISLGYNKHSYRIAFKT